MLLACAGKRAIIPPLFPSSSKQPVLQQLLSGVHLFPGWVRAGSLAVRMLVVALWYPVTSGHLPIALQCGPCSCASEIEGKAGTCAQSWLLRWLERALCDVQWRVFDIVFCRLVVLACRIQRLIQNRSRYTKSDQHSVSERVRCQCCRTAGEQRTEKLFAFTVLMLLEL